MNYLLPRDPLVTVVVVVCVFVDVLACFPLLRAVLSGSMSASSLLSQAARGKGSQEERGDPGGGEGRRTTVGDAGDTTQGGKFRESGASSASVGLPSSSSSSDGTRDEGGLKKRTGGADGSGRRRRHGRRFEDDDDDDALRDSLRGVRAGKAFKVVPSQVKDLLPFNYHAFRVTPESGIESTSFYLIVRREREG